MKAAACVVKFNCCAQIKYHTGEGLRLWGSDKSGSIRPRVAVEVAVTARESQLNGCTLFHHQVDIFSRFKTSFVRCRCDEEGGRGRDRNGDAGRRE